MKESKRLSPEEKERRHALWAEGKTDQEIAEETGRSRRVIQNWRNRNRLPSNTRKPEPGSHVTWDTAEAMRLYEKGLSDGQIALRFGVHQASIWQWRKRMGLPLNQRPKRSAPAPKEAAVKLFMTDSEILGSFRRADNKPEQVKILSELNACTMDNILDKLEELGEDVSLIRARRARRRTLDPERALRLWRSGCSDSTIARTLGVTQKSVWAWRQQAGLVPNYQRGTPNNEG